jgi:hypothetical protein
MPLVAKTSTAAKMALAYVTIGALLMIWSALTMYYDPPTTNWGQLFCTGLLLTGVALLIIGLAVGQIGRAAKPAELPTEEAAVTKTDNRGNQVTAAPVAAAGSVPLVPTTTPGLAPVVMQPPAPVLPAGTPTVPTSPPPVRRG